ncbi:MAG TPA: thiamine pyrophosphate-dependent enzyme, partial [Rhodospirillales bacterium]|nr:thiamine pyrophosphate-dependent enzyme [Rhodospirillales bacterium]
MSVDKLRTGGELIVASLLAHGVRRVFGVPGESYLPILDALHDARERIAFITCRHEHGAAMMAEAHGKLDGTPGVCMVTRGPGACNAAIGVHTAFQDSTPMLLLIGQVERRFLGREAFQEVDFEAMFRPLAKAVEQLEDTAALPAAIARAMHGACDGRPGPVVLSLPEDVLRAKVQAADVAPLPVHERTPDPGLMERLHRVLGDARRPLLLLGGGGWNDAARADIEAFATENGLPVCCGFRRNDLFDNEHPCYAGELGLSANPALVARVQAADLLLVVGSRLGEATSQGYTLPAVDGPELVHVHPDPAEPGRVFPTALAIDAGPAAFARAARRLAAVGGAHWRDWAAAARADYLADSKPQPKAAALDLGRVMRELRRVLPADAIVTVDAGNFAGWPQRFLRHGGGRRMLGATNGAMGYGLPAAIAAKLRYPERTVVACVGDGGFGMTGQELATALLCGAAPIVLIFDNAMYGTIRMHQERRYPGRVVGTSLGHPDCAALARAWGAHGERVEHTQEFAQAFARAAGRDRATVLHLICDPEQISTRTTLT